MKKGKLMQTSLGSLVREYYEDRPIGHSTMHRLLKTGGLRSRFFPSRLVVGVVAATLALGALGLALTGPGSILPLGAGAAPRTPRLVAVQIHADWCARSPEVAPIFADLMTEYGNELLLFVTLDITDDVRREQAKLLSSNLGISQVFDEPFESGMIKLIDRDNNILLAAISGPEQGRELETRIAEALDIIHRKATGGS